MSRIFYFHDRIFAAILAVLIWTVLWGLMDYDLRHPPCNACAWKQAQVVK